MIQSGVYYRNDKMWHDELINDELGIHQKNVYPSNTSPTKCSWPLYFTKLYAWYFVPQVDIYSTDSLLPSSPNRYILVQMSTFKQNN